MKPTKINWANKDEVTAYYRDYHKKKRELGKKKTYQQEYYLKNRDKIREKQNARRSKLKDNPFTKKYKEELETADYMDLLCENILEHSEEVKSWKRSSISQTVNLTYIFLAFIIGFSLCAVVVTPIVINSI